MSDRSFVLLAVTVAFGFLLAVWSLSSGEATPAAEVEPSTTTSSSTTTSTVPPTTTTTAPPPVPEVNIFAEPGVNIFDRPAPRPTPKPAPKPNPAPERSASVTTDVGDVWVRLADCESGDGTGTPPYSYTENYRGLHHGALQWHPGTWRTARQRYHERTGVWVDEFAYVAPFHVEVAVAKVWLGLTSVSQWPVCGPRVGLTMANAQ